MNPENEIHEIELSKKDAQKLVDIGKSVDRLLSNRDFKRVILEEFFQKEPVRLVGLLSDTEWQTPERQAELIADMKAIGYLRQFLNTRAAMGDQALAAIEEMDEVLEELRAEEAEA